MQPWPSVITKNEGWETLYDAQVLPPPVLQSVDEAVAWANELVTTIANAKARSSFASATYAKSFTREGGL